MRLKPGFFFSIGIELQGIEFTALPSGLHTRQNDVMYVCLKSLLLIIHFPYYLGSVLRRDATTVCQLRKWRLTTLSDY